MQKLVLPFGYTQIARDGRSVLVGPVTEVGHVSGLAPAELVRAYGIDGPSFPFGENPDHLYALRFATHPLMRLNQPKPLPEGRWPSYETGFLRSSRMIPVWDLQCTRIPGGSELWRLGSDGSESLVAVFTSPARGWSGVVDAGFPTPSIYDSPMQLVGPQARWRGVEMPADFTPDGREVEVTFVAEQAPPRELGFETVRPSVHARRVPVAECDAIFETELTATWRGAAVRVLRRIDDDALVQLLAPDLAAVQRLGAQPVDPTVFEATAPVGELDDVNGTIHEMRRTE